MTLLLTWGFVFLSGAMVRGFNRDVRLLDRVELMELILAGIA